MTNAMVVRQDNDVDESSSCDKCDIQFFSSCNAAIVSVRVVVLDAC